MKVISGTLKGRKIEGYDIEGTRPTMDRVKESLFAMIQDNIKGSIVLDLFAGSGQLGIEAISNGAKTCYFIDHNSEVIKILNKNIDNLDIKKESHVVLTDWKKFLNDSASNNLKFDLIFVDPPYDYDVYEKILEKVSTLNLLKEGGYLEKLDDSYPDCEYYNEGDLTKDEYYIVCKRCGNWTLNEQKKKELREREKRTFKGICISLASLISGFNY